MKKNTFFALNNISVSVFDKPVVQDISLFVEAGAIHAIMGPNGSGKSSLAYTLAGHPSYHVSRGSAVLDGVDLIGLPPYERAKHGLFLAFQNPCEIPGVSVMSFLKEAYIACKGVHISVADFHDLLVQRCVQLDIDQLFLTRGLNEGFSGGEKKRLELLQLLILQPKVAILDEIDSGLDVDALKVVADGIAIARAENPLLSIVLITHYQRILRYVMPDFVHVMYAGKIVESGNCAVATKVENEGYEVFRHGTQDTTTT
jgi:Fe-S cluster assembly ATP-binding protein